MSRKSIIFTILSLALILTGTGYAYWTDTLNVTTKTTTGDFEVTFADLGLYAQYSNEMQAKNWSIVDGVGKEGYVYADFFAREDDGRGSVNTIAKPNSIEQYYAGAKGYNNISFDAELVDATLLTETVGPYVSGVVKGSDKILITVDNMYPGYAQAFRSDILNVGSLAAKLSNLNFKVGANGSNPINDTTKSMLGVAVLIEREQQTSPNENGVHVFELCKALKLKSSDYFTVGGVDFVRLSALDGVKQSSLAGYENLLAIPSNNRFDFYIGVAMDPDAKGVYTTGSTAAMTGNDDSLSQNTGAQISVDLLWDQFNEGKKVNTTNILAEQNR